MNDLNMSKWDRVRINYSLLDDIRRAKELKDCKVKIATSVKTVKA